VIAVTYRHTQPGLLVLVICLLAGALGAGLSWRSGQWPATLFVIAIMMAVAVLFSSLTVEVGGNELRWHFGPGLWSYRLPLDEIRDVAVVRNRWWYGWGIRTAPGFRLYNVSGLDAVELRLKSDEIRRIGTDDPQGLAGALRAQRRD
jgi:uncharacterized membrane protein YtjA (UPF0391 family)